MQNPDLSPQGHRRSNLAGVPPA